MIDSDTANRLSDHIAEVCTTNMDNLGEIMIILAMTQAKMSCDLDTYQFKAWLMDTATTAINIHDQILALAATDCGTTQ